MLKKYYAYLLLVKLRYSNNIWYTVSRDHFRTGWDCFLCCCLQYLFFLYFHPVTSLLHFILIKIINRKPEESYQKIKCVWTCYITGSSGNHIFAQHFHCEGSLCVCKWYMRFSKWERKKKPHLIAHHSCWRWNIFLYFGLFWVFFHKVNPIQAYSVFPWNSYILIGRR